MIKELKQPIEKWMGDKNIIKDFIHLILIHRKEINL